MAKKTPDSLPIQLLEIVWRGANSATRHSWERLNHAMAHGLTLAIEAGMKFDPGDFSTISENFRFGRWSGETGGEQFYAAAVAGGNLSACAAFEKYKDRPAYILDHGRVAVGCEFLWKGEQVKVTSIVDSSLTACAYRSVDQYRSRIVKRYTITIETIRLDRAERKERATIEAAFVKDRPLSEKVLKVLKIKKRSEWDACPIEKIRAAVKAVESGRKRLKKETEEDFHGSDTDQHRSDRPPRDPAPARGQRLAGSQRERKVHRP